MIDVDLVATRLTQHVTEWCIGGPCGSVCDRRESRRYMSDTASRGRRHLQETTRRIHSGLVRTCVMYVF